MSFSALAVPKIALLIAIDNPQISLFYRSKNWSLSEDLIQYFKKKMGSTPYELVIFKDANQEILHQELTNPDNIALFWLSHSTSFSDFETGLGFDDTIIDSEGHNVRDIFQNIHPHLKFLSVLGCKAGPILQKLRDEGFYKNNQDLFIFSKDKNIYAKKEIRKSIQAFKEKIHSFKENTLADFEKKGIPIKVKRTIPESQEESGTGTSVKILNRGKLLGLFPKAKRGETQSLIVYLDPENLTTTSDLKIVIDSGIISKDKKILLGIVEIESESLDGEWKPFTDSSGQILGVTQNIYRYKGSLNYSSLPTAYEP